MFSVRGFILMSAVLLAGTALLLTQCTNNPYRPGEAAEATLFTTFYSPPTKLDPATSYFSHEGYILDKIVEPPLEYHYLKRPYELIPLTAEAVPEPAYYGKDGNRLPRDPDHTLVARAEYTIRIRKGILYQDHPCFARDAGGKPLYANLTAADLSGIETPNDFPRKGTRELVAEDYVRQVRRLADPRLASPIFSSISRYIMGLEELQDTYDRMLAAERTRRREQAGIGYNQERSEKLNPIPLDYMKPGFAGAKVLDRYTYKLVLKRKYPQMLYWLAMHFFSPVPQEAIDFYSQTPLIEMQIVLNRWPVGTGAHYLAVFEPNREIALARNMNHRPEFYPAEGMPGDREQGFLDDAGKPMPFVGRLVLKYEKEAIPRWNKFLQGYFDDSGIVSEVFDQTITLSSQGELTLSEDMKHRGMRMLATVGTSIYCFGFNMKDDVVGGYTPEKQKLRQAISIAIDFNEYLEIFANDRGISAQGLIPPGVFGHREGQAGTNPYVDVWDAQSRRHVRRPIEDARRLLAEAGYPNGRGTDGRPLVLYFDHSSGGDAQFPVVLDWYRRRFALLGIDLRERATDLKRMREKLDSGSWQLHRLGWLADYPDPENFMFLLYGPNAKVPHGGENSCNYSNPEYDKLFVEMESMENGPERQKIIDRMTDIARRDAPWVWGYHPLAYGLQHAWFHNGKPHQMSSNTLKYLRVEPAPRVQRQIEWNEPRYWPVLAAVGVLIAAMVPAVIVARRRERGR